MVDNKKSRLITQAIDRLGCKEFFSHEVVDEILNKGNKYAPTNREMSQLLRGAPSVKKIGLSHGHVLWSKID